MHIDLILDKPVGGVVDVAGFRARGSWQRVLLLAGSRPRNRSSIEGIHDGWLTTLAES